MSLVRTRTRAARWRTAPPEETIKRCDLCDAARFDLVAERDREGEVLHTGICLRCGLVCHMAIPSEAELAEFYAVDYRSQYHGELTPSPRRVMRAWKNAERIYRQLAPHISPSDKVFEVGAGIGCNVKVFELQGHDASGIEPNLGFQAFSVDQLRARVTRGDLFNLDEEARYDLVLLVHVIEHFRSPRRALERIYGLLQPGGKLYVECPNLAAPFARPGRLFHYAHVHNFTPWTLEMMAGRCGFEVERAFSEEEDPNLQMLLRRSDTPSSMMSGLRVDADNLPRTLAALRKYNAVTYHLRWNYLRDRAGKLASYFDERLRARAYVRRLIARCQAEPSAPAA